MLWGVAPRTLKEVKAPTILLPIGGGGREGLGFSCLIDFFSCQLEFKFYFHTSGRSKTIAWYIHEANMFFQRFFTKDLLVNSSRYLLKDAF